MSTHDKSGGTSTPRTDAHLEHLNLPNGQKIGIPDITLELMRELERDIAVWRAKAKRWQEIADRRAIEVADLKHAAAHAGMEGDGRFNADLSADRPIEQQLDGGAHWEWPVNTIGRLVENLKSYPQETPLHTAYFVEIGDQRIAKTTHPSVSRETVYDGRIQKFDAARQSIVIWATAAPVTPNSSERTPFSVTEGDSVPPAPDESAPSSPLTAGVFSSVTAGEPMVCAKCGHPCLTHMKAFEYDVHPHADYPTAHPDRCRLRDGGGFRWSCHKKAGHVAGNGGEHCSTHRDCGARNAERTVCGYEPDHTGPHAWEPQAPNSATRVPDSVMEPCVQAFYHYNDGHMDADECVCAMATALQIVRRSEGRDANG